MGQLLAYQRTLRVYHCVACRRGLVTDNWTYCSEFFGLRMAYESPTL